MSIDDAIATYVDLTENVFSATKIGGDGKFSSKAFEEVIKRIVMRATRNEHEMLMDDHPEACKV